jgi:inner membrane protein
MRLGEAALGFSAWYAFWALVLITHPMLDALTVYGTQLLAPFSNQPFGVAGVSIIDPVYTLPLIGVLIYAARTLDKAKAWRAVIGMLMLTTAYLGLSWSQNPAARDLAEADLNARGIAFEKVEAYTTIFSPWLRRVMATDQAGHIKVGFVSTLNPQPIRWVDLPHDAAAEALAKTVAGRPEAQVFNRFARGPKVATIVTTPEGGRELRITDARYGFPGGPTLDGLWGIAFPLDASGAVNGPAYRFERIRDQDFSNIGAFFRAQFGLPQDVI